MRYFIIIILTFLKIYSLEAQNSFQNFENSLKLNLDSATISVSDSVKLWKMETIQNELAELLKDPASYTYPFDSLKSIGKIKSPDNAFRLFSWNTFLSTDSAKNFAVIQFKPEKDKPCRTIPLHDNVEINEAGNAKLSSKHWYGALYYKIIPVKFDGNTFYTVLGLDSYSPYISKKIIDVLYFNSDEVFFGAPVFNVAGKNVSRMVFSFSARISMMLNYDETLKTIVFDHLSPSEARYNGQFEYYGPDFSFDGFLLTKKNWLFVEDVKPNRPPQKKKK